MISSSLLKDLETKQAEDRARSLDLAHQANKAADHPWLSDEYSAKSEYHRGRADAFDVVIRMARSGL